MMREQILRRLGFIVGEKKKKRVLILSDIKTEADDPYAIVHHLLSPTEQVCGIIACHFESKYSKSDRFSHLKGSSAQASYDEGKLLLKLMEIDDVPLVKGAQYPLMHGDQPPESAGADLIIAEGMKEDDTPLYIVCLGALTALAIALQKEPRIAWRMTAILIAGAAYPRGGPEPNLEQDIAAARIVFDSHMSIWQIPQNVYSQTEISLAEVVDKVRPCGKLGQYLCDEMLALNDFYGQVPFRMAWPHGETWIIGDNPTAFVLLQSENRVCWHIEHAPIIHDDMSYGLRPGGKEIRVYDSVDNRLGLDDFFSKLHLCYGVQY